jgi:putative phage-type endonuclease
MSVAEIEDLDVIGPEPGPDAATLAREAQQRAKFHAERLTGIGGSDIAAIVGMHKRTAFDVWLEKTGQVEPEDLSDIEEVEWGNLHEDTVARKYARVTNRRVRRVNQMLRHPELEFAIAHPDRLIIGEPGGLEIKTAGYWVGQTDAWGEIWTDQVPYGYNVQCQWYMGVTGRPWWDLAALIGGNRFKPYHLERDEELIAALFTRAAEFWYDYVLPKKIPPNSASAEEALAKYPVSTATSIEANEEIVKAVIAYNAAKDAAGAAEEDHKKLYPIIADYMGENGILTWRGEKIMSWNRRSNGKKIDSKAHEAAEPECHAKFIRETFTRAMLRGKEPVL